jgi:hypothetical protein
MPAWWVHAHQVSKTTENGDLLTAGDFIIKGEKNFLASSQLVLGFAALFQISQQSIPNHRKHRLYDTAEAEAGAETTRTPEHLPSDDEKEQRIVNMIEEEEQDEDGQDTPNPGAEMDSADKGSLDPSPLQANIIEHDEGENPDDIDFLESMREGGHDQIQEKETEEIQDPASTIENVNSPIVQHSQSRRFPLKREKSLDSPSPIKEGTNEALPTLSVVDTPSRSTTPSLVFEPVKQSPVAVVRGRKGKAKKAAVKYADQDEEDRELALHLFGANTKTSKAAEAASAKAKREAEMEARKQRRRAQHERAAEAERKRQAQFEKRPGEGVDENDEERAQSEAADLSWLPALVGTPLPSDEVLTAIPVCAPWAALNQYKYRAKLQPGSVKKGKAVQEILGHWLVEATQRGKGKRDHNDDQDLGVSHAAMERLQVREAELLKAWRPVEIINTVPVGKVRIIFSASGGGGSGGGSGKGRSDDKRKSKGGGDGGSKAGKKK